MANSLKTTAGLLLVVILASSLVLSNLLIFSAGQIAAKTEDLSVQLEVMGEDTSNEGDFLAMFAKFLGAVASPTKAATEHVHEINDGETSWSSTFDYGNFGKVINATNKQVVLVFDDGWKSQYEQAKPILDKYGYKATFFIVCDYVGYKAYMTWRNVRDLHNSGHDIQSHSMTHSDLTKLSAEELDYELAQSKECLNERGIESTIFATPYNKGWNNATVVEALSRHYEFAKNGNDKMMYLQCDGWTRLSNQTDCRTFDDDSDPSTLTYANRYSIRAWSHNYYDALYGHDDAQTFGKFVEAINAPYVVQPNSKANSPSIVVLEYHRIDDEKTGISTSPALFEAEMRYLRDNGFSVLTMDQFRYDDYSNYLYLSEKLE